MSASPPPRGRVLLCVLCCLLVSLPLLAVRFPPITDLPALTGQIGLFLRALDDPEGPYRIQWWAPNQLSYWILGACWAVAGPRDAGRLAVVLIGALWVVSLHALSRRRRRSAGAAVVASLFFFNHGLYYGFLSFAVGLPAFVVWLELTARREGDTLGRRDAAAIFAGAALLYASHALWLAAGLVWLAVDSLAARRPARAFAWRLACASPLLVAAGFWYPRLAASGFASQTLWGPSPLARLDPSRWVDAALGGLRGPAEPALLAAVAAWWLLALWQRRTELAATVDRWLLAAAALPIAAFLTLPARFSNTIQFGSRWLPIGLALLALALPAPRLRPSLRRAVPVAMLAALCVTTATAWTRFERRELTGLEEALEALPEGRRTVGYDFLHTSAVVKSYPFYHLPAYAQLYRDAELHFSFADHASSPVVFKDLPRSIPWRPGEVRRSDLRHYDYALIGALPDLHHRLAANDALVPATGDGRWRLYQVRR